MNLSHWYEDELKSRGDQWARRNDEHSYEVIKAIEKILMLGRLQYELYENRICAPADFN